jgi:hypothetical protein
MHLEFLLEEQSMEAALLELVPKMVPDHSFELHPHRGKPDLLRKLEGRLRGYARWNVPDVRVVVVVDRDADDCHALKQSLLAVCDTAGMPALCRIAIEELEAWFFGDIPALCAAYPGVPRTLAARKGFRDPDAIQGGTWEALERVLRRAGHYPTGMPKVEVATRVAERMDVEHNASRSFQVLRDGLRALLV